jgi:ABC-2 type transport system permease protein
VLAGRALADTAVLVWGLGITAAIGLAVGFRLHGSPADALAAFGLLVVFGFAFEWLFLTLGRVHAQAQVSNWSVAFWTSSTNPAMVTTPPTVASTSPSRPAAAPAPACQDRGRSRRTASRPRCGG